MEAGDHVLPPRPPGPICKQAPTGGRRYSWRRLENAIHIRSSVDRRWRNALAEYEMGVEGKARGVDALSGVLGRQDAANNRRIIAGICQLVIGTG